MLRESAHPAMNVRKPHSTSGLQPAYPPPPSIPLNQFLARARCNIEHPQRRKVPEAQPNILIGLPRRFACEITHGGRAIQGSTSLRQGERTGTFVEEKQRLSALGLTWAQECSVRHCTN